MNSWGCTQHHLTIVSYFYPDMHASDGPTLAKNDINPSIGKINLRKLPLVKESILFLVLHSQDIVQ